ncbi:hypothetical protein [Micromonospora sp. NPDC093244]|uniref:hypothetical protein n=1 Tax=Micromonospora sp. NPDC093244 TaxID=3155071 RepID=UPI00343D2C29
MNTAEVAEALGTTPRTLRQFLRSPSSPVKAVGSGVPYKFSESDLPTLRQRFADWNWTGKPKAKTTRVNARPQRKDGTCDQERQRDEAVWAEDGPVVLEDLDDPEVRAKVRRIAAEQEARLELRLLAAGLHISQGAQVDSVRLRPEPGDADEDKPPVRVERRKPTWTRPPGSRWPNAKLTKAEADEIRSWYAEGGVSQAEVAQQYGVSQTQISLIVRGRCWKSAS